jgi:hypothetical protein
MQSALVLPPIQRLILRTFWSLGYLEPLETPWRTFSSLEGQGTQKFKMRTVSLLHDVIRCQVMGAIEFSDAMHTFLSLLLQSRKLGIQLKKILTLDEVRPPYWVVSIGVRRGLEKGQLASKIRKRSFPFCRRALGQMPSPRSLKRSPERPARLLTGRKSWGTERGESASRLRQFGRPTIGPKGLR